MIGEPSMPAKAPTDKKPMSKDEREAIKKKFTAIPDVPATIRNILGKDNVRTFMEILTSPEAVDVDCMLQCGDLSEKEAAQYWEATGDYDRCAHKLTELALKIASEQKPKLLTLVKNELRGMKKEGIRTLFISLSHLREIRLGALKQQAAKVDQLADAFMFQVTALIGSDLIDLANDSNTDREIARLIKFFIQEYNDIYLRQTGVEFNGIQYHNEKRAYKATFDSAEGTGEFNIEIGFQGQLSERQRVDLQSENRALLAHIRAEAPYKMIPLVTLHDDQPQIILMRDNSNSDYPYGSLCSGRIRFGRGQSVSFPKLSTDRQGMAYYDYGVSPNIVNFVMDPETGDLCFITSHIPFDQVLNPDRYLALQHYVLKGLSSYLDSKDPDREDLFTQASSVVATEEERIETETISEDEISAPRIDEIHQAETAPEIISDEHPQGTPNAGEAVGESTPAAETPWALPKHFRKVIMDCISGARAEDILAALRRMFGRAVRTEGSHIFFRSERTGVTLPIPLHSRSSKHHIALPLIISCLRAWGYSPLELARELGADIPSRMLRQVPPAKQE